MPADELTPESIIKLAADIEQRIQGGAGPRPLLSVPHIISDEASCYYHGCKGSRPVSPDAPTASPLIWSRTRVSV